MGPDTFRKCLACLRKAKNLNPVLLAVMRSDPTVERRFDSVAELIASANAGEVIRGVARIDQTYKHVRIARDVWLERFRLRHSTPESLSRHIATELLEYFGHVLHDSTCTPQIAASKSGRRANWFKFQAGLPDQQVVEALESIGVNVLHIERDAELVLVENDESSRIRIESALRSKALQNQSTVR
jgi:hypothetical protein